MNISGSSVSPFVQSGHQISGDHYGGDLATRTTGRHMTSHPEPAAAGSNINRPRSTSNASTSFPSSHDAFGLSASPSATSSMTKVYTPGNPNNTRQSSPWSFSGSNGYGLYGLGSNAAMMPDTSANSSSGNQFAHGVLPTSTLLGDPQFRMNRPSGLSQAWAGDDMESEDVSTGTGRTLPSGLDSANTDVEQWRSNLDLPPHLRRSQSSFASIPDPKSPQLDNPGGYNVGLSAPSSSSRFSMALRRVSSEHSAVRDSSDISGAYRAQGQDGFSPGSMTQDTQAGHDNLDRIARTPPKSFGYSFGGKRLSGHRDSADGMEAGGGSDEGNTGRERSMSGGYLNGGRRRSSMMDAAQPRLLPANLRKTLAAEANLPMQEIRSEALLQRLILSNSESLPMTPRPSRRGRLLNSLPEAESDDSNDEQEDDNSSDEGPFAVDDLVTGEDMATGGMDVEMSAHHSSPFAFAPANGMRASRQYGASGRSAQSRTSQTVTCVGVGDFGQTPGMLADDRHDMRASQGSARGSDASGSGMDVASGSKSNATAWRESPAASGRTNKRKAAFDDARFEPYNKRYRPGDQSPSHWTGTLPPGPTPMSPTGHHVYSDPMDFTPHATSRSISFARSRGGSPAATSQIQAMRTVSPVTSSPLASMAAAGTNGGPIGMPPGMAMGYRPTIGMGGLGMLLMSKRNGQGVGTGLMGNDGETAVAEGIGGMDVRSRDQDGEEEDEMVFD